MTIETDLELAERLGRVDMSIYKKKLGDQNFDYVPHCVYFYYIRINRNGALAVDHYEYGHGENGEYTANPKDWVRLEPEEIPEITKKLAFNARPRKKWLKKSKGGNFEDILWRRRSYIVFFFDEKNWAFHSEATKVPAVIFKTDAPGCDPNKAFFDGKDMLIDMGNGHKRSAVCFINHMTKDDRGTLLGDKERRNYKMDFLLRVGFAKPGKNTKRLTVIIDPPGGNQGPPSQP